MREITEETAADYLRETGRAAEADTVDVRTLGGGVSNVVLRVQVGGDPPFVLKQARGRLRTKALWESRLDRVWNERDAMAVLGEVLPDGSVPRVVFSDEANYLFAMTSAPADSVVWKERLLAGDADPAVGRLAGETLGTLHAATRNHPALAGRLADLSVFDELRVDPFDRYVARAHPAIATALDRLNAEAAAVDPRCLVLADFSPKNILVHGRGLTLVDFETAHAGDPAYDLGFFASHVLLKALRAARLGRPDPRYVDLLEAFLGAYEGIAAPGLDVLRRAGCRAAACVLARVDGKSPVDYLDEPARAAARSFALDALGGPSVSLDAVIGRAAREMLPGPGAAGR